MISYLWYIVEANLVMILLYGVFKLIKRFLSFGWQRFSLLSIPLLSILVVWIKQLPTYGSFSYRIPIVELEPIQVRGKAIAPTGFNPVWIELVYWLGAALFFVWMISRLYKVLKTIRFSNRKKEAGYTVIEVPEQESYSFFRVIHLRKGLSGEDRDIVFQHEKIHADKLHSADRLYLEMVHCSAWFNPLLPFMKKELIHIHEFEVDRIMYNKYHVSYMEFLLAYALGTSSSSYLFTNQFLTQLTLIKRIKIMKNTSKKVWIAALALPLIAGTLSFVSITPERKTTAEGRAVNARNLPAETQQMATQADKAPEFVGGMPALIDYMVKNVNYPKAAEQAKVTGKVMVSFVVTKTGKVTRVAVKQGVSKELDAEAKRVIMAMPDWIPGEKNAEKIEAEMLLPVSFQL